MNKGISYAIPVCNEHQELDALLELLTTTISPEDEIVILYDSKNTTQDVKSVVEKYKLTNVHEHELNQNFAAHKNYLKSKCNCPVIFQLDADELPTPDLLELLPQIIEANQDTDLICIPRINIVHGLTQEHVDKWQWRVNEKGYVNFPDFQMRLIHNKQEIKWVGAVHEKIEGHTKYAVLPAEELYCIYHIKGIERQEQQNEFYNSI